jgi:hypothetical protein
MVLEDAVQQRPSGHLMRRMSYLTLYQRALLVSVEIIAHDMSYADKLPGSFQCDVLSLLRFFMAHFRNFFLTKRFAYCFPQQTVHYYMQYVAVRNSFDFLTFYEFDERYKIWRKYYKLTGASVRYLDKRMSDCVRLLVRQRAIGWKHTPQGNQLLSRCNNWLLLNSVGRGRCVPLASERYNFRKRPMRPSPNVIVHPESELYGNGLGYYRL